MPHDLFLNGPEPPRPPYQIPESKETTRLAGQWKALSGKVKIGVVVGGVLSLGAVGAMANPLTSTTPPTSASVSAPATTAAPPTTATVAPTTKAATTAKTTTAAAAKATVTSGAFCSGAGTTGVTSTGKAMVCKTSATDTRLRWRAA